MNESKQSERLEVGDGVNVDDSSVELWRGRRTLPAIQMSVMCSASEGAETILVTVGDGDSWSSRRSRCPWDDALPQRVNRKCGEEIKGWLWLIKTAGPSAPNELTRDAGPRGSPAQPSQTILSLWKWRATPLSSIHLPFPEPSPTSTGRTGRPQLNHVTFALSHSFQPQFEYEKGRLFPPSKTITLMTFGSHLIY